MSVGPEDYLAAILDEIARASALRDAVTRARYVKDPTEWVSATVVQHAVAAAMGVPPGGPLAKDLRGLLKAEGWVERMLNGRRLWRAKLVAEAPARRRRSR